MLHSVMLVLLSPVLVPNASDGAKSCIERLRASLSRPNQQRRGPQYLVIKGQDRKGMKGYLLSE